jgi:hypothetical protein
MHKNPLVGCARNGDILIANFGSDRLEVMNRAGVAAADSCLSLA